LVRVTEFDRDAPAQTKHRERLDDCIEIVVRKRLAVVHADVEDDDVF
jgi:hypothetical protein